MTMELPDGAAQTATSLERKMSRSMSAASPATSGYQLATACLLFAHRSQRIALASEIHLLHTLVLGLLLRARLQLDLVSRDGHVLGDPTPTFECAQCSVKSSSGCASDRGNIARQMSSSRRRMTNLSVICEHVILLAN